MKFSEYLITESLKTKADIKKAIDSFDELPEGKQAMKAREILKVAEDVGYIVKKTEILKFKKKEKTKEISKSDSREQDRNKKTNKIEVYIENENELYGVNSGFCYATPSDPEEWIRSHKEFIIV